MNEPQPADGAPGPTRSARTASEASQGRGSARGSEVQEAREVQMAMRLIEVGARLQLLKSEVKLSGKRLLRLYKEVKGASPPKGLLPFSVDWYMTWRANIDASMFYNMYLCLAPHADSRLDAMIKAFSMYRQQLRTQGDTPMLDFTRAATLVKYFESDMLQLSTCTRCTGRFVAHAYDGQSRYVCVLCRPPSRAGKKKRVPRAAPGDSPPSPPRGEAPALG